MALPFTQFSDCSVFPSTTICGWLLPAAWLYCNKQDFPFSKGFHFISESLYHYYTDFYRASKDSNVILSHRLIFCIMVKINFYVIFSTKPVSHHKLKAPISHKSLNISCYWPKLRSVVSKILQKQSLDLQVDSRRIE